MKENKQLPTPQIDAKYPIEETTTDESYGLIWPSKTSDTAIVFWCLAALGVFVVMGSFFAFANSLDYILIASLVGSSLTLLWMGHVVNYLKQIANKKV